jgi:hypothetical protein
MALIDVIDTSLIAMDEGKLSLLVLLDLSCAFDSISHELLISKLNDCGVRESALGWLKTYLTQRTQSVIINE